MKKVQFTEFRQNAAKLFDRVEEGETVYVTRHGREIARISPVGDGSHHQPSWKKKRNRVVIPGSSVASAILSERE